MNEYEYQNQNLPPMQGAPETQNPQNPQQMSGPQNPPMQGSPETQTPPVWYAQAYSTLPPRQPKPSQPYPLTASDALFAFLLLALGFLFWEWQVLFAFETALGRFAFFIGALVVCFIYLQLRGLRQNARSLVMLAVAVLGILPFLLYDPIDITAFLVPFDFGACLLWLAYSCRTTVSQKLSGFLISDYINQTFVVPFTNFAGFFRSFHALTKKNEKSRGILAGIIGIVIAIPVIALVLSLLISADAGFEKFMHEITKLFLFKNLGTYIFELVLGLPVACYIFGALFGNAHKRHVSHITKEGSEKALERARRIPAAAIYAPLTLLNLIYIVFIVVLGTYLFSAFMGQLPTGSSASAISSSASSAGFTYAEYARRGFFELCGVTAINLFVIVFTYCFAKRGATKPPKPLRVLTAILTSLTVLLDITAISKMLLYVDVYGLSRLRIYTLWFMLLLFCVFAVLLIWHLRPFNAGRPIVAICVAFVLALFLANTDGLIAHYNVMQYEQGKVKSVDTEMLESMSDAVLPWLYELQQNAPDAEVREQAAQSIRNHEPNRNMLSNPDEYFYTWNLQTARVARE